MIIWGIDIGKKGGITIYNDSRETRESFPIECHSLVNFYHVLLEIISSVKGIPNIIITGKPNRMYNIVLAHAQYIGVLGLLAEQCGAEPVWMENDNTMRKEILGVGNGNNKAMVHEKYKGETPDVSDSMLFVDYAIKILAKGSR